MPPEAVHVVEYADPTSFGKVAGVQLKVGSAAITPVKFCVPAVGAASLSVARIVNGKVPAVVGVPVSVAVAFVAVPSGVSVAPNDADNAVPLVSQM